MVTGSRNGLNMCDLGIPDTALNMRLVALLPIVLVCSVNAQWSNTNAPIVDRYDDVFFIGADTGWAAGGGQGTIIRTYNGGADWDIVFNGGGYLRSIEFATPDVGFCGTLDSRFLRTTDGGDTWQDIASTITPTPIGICGLSAPTADHIYGVGVWSQPAYIIRSTDGGTTWTNTSMAAQATALVDVLFLNADTGFASGRANPVSAGGVILRTDDGGGTWAVVHTTGTGSDYIWKLQTPDGVHLYGSIDGPPGSGTRYVRSSDAGVTWQTDTITMDYYYVQVIGFLDTQRGWTGGYGQLLETTDGGENWSLLNFGNAHDRFHRVDGSTAYMTGSGIYKFNDPTTVVPAHLDRPYPERIAVLPNPAAENARIEIDLKAATAVELELFTADGRWLALLHRGWLAAGQHELPLEMSKLALGSYFATLRTNEGHLTTPFQVR